MKIAHICYSLMFGGIETLLVNISNWQCRNNNEVSIILINNLYEKSLIDALDNRINIIYLNRVPKSKSPWPILKLNFYILKNKYDILHIHSAGIGNIILTILNSKRILHVHSTTQITNSKIPKFDKCITISNAVKHTLESKFNVKNIHVIYNGINFDDFETKKSSIPTNKIVCVGRLDIRIKNQDGLIKEFSRIKDQITANLYLVGDGPDRNILVNLIRDLNLENRVILLGNKDQNWIKQHLREFDLLIQASFSEGLGIAAIEAAAACTPMILSNLDGHLEISENGYLCSLFDPKIEGDLGKKINDFYEDIDQIFKISMTNCELYREKFDIEYCNKKIIDLYYSFQN